MNTALILSSAVAASRIGGVVQQLALARLGVHAVLVPTVLYGRSPALGGTGHPVAPEVFESLLGDVEAHGVFEACDLLITGHFSFEEQVVAAAQTVMRVRQVSPGARIVVDPVMGDAPKGLYVKPEVARAVAGDLLPLADWITPNAWELQHLTGVEITGPQAALAAARRLKPKVLATSVPVGSGELGLVCWDGGHAELYVHAREKTAPNGVGDLVTGVFGAGLVEGLTPQAAAAWAGRAVIKAVAAGSADLAVEALSESLLTPGAEMRIEALS